MPVSARVGRSAYTKEKREALELWANHLRVIVGKASGANVTTLKPKRAWRTPCAPSVSGVKSRQVLASRLSKRDSCTDGRPPALPELRPFCYWIFVSAFPNRGAERSHKDFTSVGSRGFRNFDGYLRVHRSTRRP